MSEHDAANDGRFPALIPAKTPGQLIGDAREELGLNITVLAAALKVPARKLEALEANRWDELTDATFIRALACSVARQLKMDVEPVLLGLPKAEPVSLNPSTGLGLLGQEGALVSLGGGIPAISKMQHGWFVGLLLASAALLYFSPQLAKYWLASFQPAGAKNSLSVSPLVAVAPQSEGVGSPNEDVASFPAMESQVEPSPSSQVEDSSPAPAPAPAASSVITAVLVGPTQAEEPVLFISASSETWIEVADRSGQILIKRSLRQSEDVAFAEGAPFAVVVGNVAGVRVTARGQLMDLAELTKTNVARFMVK